MLIFYDLFRFTCLGFTAIINLDNLNAIIIRFLLEWARISGSWKCQQNADSKTISLHSQKAKKQAKISTSYFIFRTIHQSHPEATSQDHLQKQPQLTHNLLTPKSSRLLSFSVNLRCWILERQLRVCHFWGSQKIRFVYQTW